MADARDDLAAKLRLEGVLLAKLRALDRRTVREVVRRLGTSGALADLDDLVGSELEALLVTHYADVGGVFASRTRPRLDADVAATSAEDDQIDTFLASFYAARAGEQSRRIVATSQADAADALRLARDDQLERQAEGEEVGPRDLALIAGTFFSRMLIARQPSIASFETQAAAEAAKSVEVSVLLGQPPLSAAPPPPVPVEKAWVTQGDSRVRSKHIVADGQRVPTADPFVVGGERLMYPGDTSLGASDDNVINCRCSSEVDPVQVGAARRLLG